MSNISLCLHWSRIHFILLLRLRRLCLSTDHKGRQFWAAAAERKNAGRFIVQADQMLAVLRELESVTRDAISKIR